MAFLSQIPSQTVPSSGRVSDDREFLFIIVFFMLDCVEDFNPILVCKNVVSIYFG
jgi:hypothetical protein